MVQTRPGAPPEPSIRETERKPTLERSPLPDVAQDSRPAVGGSLERVGMSGVETMLRVRDEEGRAMLLPAHADAYVDLVDPEAKGIHMSRLFLAVQSALESRELAPNVVEDILRRFLRSHDALSTYAYLQLSHVRVLRRSALVSGHSGFRHYPVRIESSLRGGKFSHRLHVRVTYSSSCPCSAALARQLRQERFEQAFQGHGWVSVGHVKSWLGTRDATVAVPHSQRSEADVSIELSAARQDFPVEDLVNVVEDALRTPVQTAVKREDEQEFARLNGAHLMFCEDAARAIRAAVSRLDWAIDWRIQVRHLESLHPHDAVAIVTRGLPDGFRP